MRAALLLAAVAAVVVFACASASAQEHHESVEHHLPPEHHLPEHVPEHVIDHTLPVEHGVVHEQFHHPAAALESHPLHGDNVHDPLAHTITVHTNPEAGNTVHVIRRQIDSPLEDIQWASDEVLFVLTEKGQVWRSADSGKDWKNIMPKLQSEHPEGGSVKSMYISAVDSQSIFLLGSTKVNWFSHDQGKTFHTCEADLHDVRMHPTQKTWMLGATMSAGCTDKDSAIPCYKELKVSKDLCAHWETVDTYVVQFDWSPPVGAPDHEGARASDDLIYVTTHSQKAGAQKFGFWDKDIDFVQSYTYFKQAPTVLVPHGNRFLFGEHSYLFVAAVNPVHETEVHLMISRDNETHKLFQKAILPVDLTQHSYTILDTSEGSVFLHVNHQPFSENAPTGHVYISDWSGLVYSLSLPFNHRSSDGKCDFEKVEGLEGIYLANFIDEAAEGEKTLDAEESEESMGHASSGSDKISHHAKPHIKAKTVITFDKGGLWSYLDAPTHDVNGQPTNCPSGGCHLHLHGVTDTFGPFYSTKEATGLIMATGTIGNYLKEDSEINTFLSRDAGLTWNEVRKGSHIYEFGDHGGLLVMADDNKLSHSIVYSWDSGHTWSELVISDTPFQIENIIIEPTATSQVFIVYGWQESSGVLVFLDFAELHQHECKGRDAPGTPESDYELWSPRGEPPSKCLMGHHVSYVRRKAERPCYNPDAFEKVGQYKACACTAEDFECDYGYERKETVDEAGNKLLNGPCELAHTPPTHQDPTAGSECVHTSFKRITRGYRRVPGDTCEGGNDQFDAILMPCGFLASGSLGRFFFVLFGLILLGLVIAVLNAKYGVCNVCLIQARRLGWGAGRGPAYSAVHENAHEPDDAQSYLNEEEFGKSAELLADGLPKQKKSKSINDSAAGGAVTSSKGDASLLDAAVVHDEPIKPLPPSSAAASIPTLAAPGGDDDFNPRSKNN